MYTNRLIEIVALLILAVVMALTLFRCPSCRTLREGIDVLNQLPPEFAASGYSEASSIIGQSGIRNSNERAISKAVLQRR